MRLELFRSPTSLRSRGSRDIGTAIALINHRILEILIQTTTAIARINHQIPHPVNPEILEILIQTISHSDRSSLIILKLATSSCKS
ncbi:hypothetical protein [Dolichospermum sp. LEGE 00246]|uniref:hypothetical protein n=1 Tax=Dolichospermum sp. LEGE 00246 TaxID=1828605 RepID=UPI00188017F2|nr:hypothetical protein [Dolichospermum sp. LEGE 00246]MBE9258139.1 hypothetical protein [Dolichospermum sp. LEGE 00246]